ncbi:hypothetical protein [Cytobacillus kochii]|uniref:hypothetical protein n=1 Tax=Cytobacillus kochii TaxID=859143 RepID=UPI00203D0FFF|nr:hypothetical protein [Cytobacillus kochii]MCM3322705.1 hypothetical protein [Cytobacillus kochii]MCM3344816.1 hypothetical protein [Cytobacillus kochii]
MKKFYKLIGIGLLVVGVLAGCGEEVTSNADEPKEAPKAADQKDKKVSEPKKDEAGNTILEEPGQKAESEAGTAELIKINKVNETVNVSPLKITIQDIKVIELSDVDSVFAEDLAFSIDGEAELLEKGFSYVQIQYNVENTQDQNIEWYDLVNVITDKGEQIDGMMKDFFIDDADLDSEFIGKVKKEYTDAFVIKDKDINSVKLVFGNTMNADTFEDITGEQTVEYKFE